MIKSKTDTEKVFNLLFLTAYLLMVITFFLGKIFDAFHKPFWTDEIFALTVIKKSGYLHLLFNGAYGEGSPAPLDYIACKILNQIKDIVSYFGFTPEIYFRLFANGVTAFSALVILYLFKKDIRGGKSSTATRVTQLLLLLCIPIAYLFRTPVHYFAAEMRPYALWNSLFMITLATSYSEGKNRRLFFFSLALLAFSATASIFQICALAVAYFIVQVTIMGNKIKNILKCEIGLFAIPFFIALYYCLLPGKWNMVSFGGSWEDFVNAWLHKFGVIPLMLLAIMACFLKKENRKYAVAALAFLILFLIGPLIFLITRLKGFFYTGRQYIYYELATAVFILTLIKCIPAYVKNIGSKRMVNIILIVACLTGASLALKPKFIKNFIETENKAFKVLSGGIDTDPGIRP